MFKKLQICNFQSHEETKLDFDPGVNVICGMSGSGKTAIVRAIRLLLTNRPSGARYFSNFAKSGYTNVDLKLDEGPWVGIQKKVVRKDDGTKDLKATEYFLDDGVTDNPESWQTGTKVPDEIARLVNIGEINISTQFDKHFLILSSPGEVARTINRLTKLEQVDGWKSALTKRINGENSDIKLLKGQLAEYEAEKLKFANFQQMASDIDALLKLESSLSNDNLRRSVIDGALVKVEKLDNELKTGLDQEELEYNLSDLLVADSTIEGLIAEKLVINSVKRLSQTIDDLTGILHLLEQAVAYHEDEKFFGQLTAAISKIDRMDDDIKQKETGLDNAKMQYMDKLKKEKECPVCMSPIDNKTLKKIGASL